MTTDDLTTDDMTQRASSTVAADMVRSSQVAVLTQALPYIQRFAGKIVVVKFGGNAMTSPELAATFAKDIVLMHSVGLKPVVVHGGGPQIGDMMKRLGKDPVFVDGQRVTDKETLDIARMVLLGQVNNDIVSDLNTAGGIAGGLSGQDAGLIQAQPRDPALGFVGTVTGINPGILHRLLAEDVIPVVATIGGDGQGQAYNINADTVAAALAVALDAEKLLYLTDIEGLLADPEDPTSLIGQIEVGRLHALSTEGAISGGMIPKVEGCLRAVNGGVGSAHIINGATPHVVLLELFTDSGIGTMVCPAGTIASSGNVVSQ